jgi:hypothetical protein
MSNQYPIPLVKTHTHKDIQGDSRLMDITAGADFLGLNHQKININMGHIFNGYGVMGVVFKLLKVLL